MDASDKRQQELARARELIPLLEPHDPYRLGLYALLRVLSEEASERGLWCDATIVERKIFDDEMGVTPAAYGYALLAGGTLLGHGGEEGWDAIGQRVATEKELAGCFMPSYFTVIQRAHAELNWVGAEEEEIEAAIQARLEALRAAMRAKALSEATVSSLGVAPRRGL